MLTQTNPLHLTITSLLIYCKWLNRCYEPSVVLFFHVHKDKKIMWVPNQTNGWMMALYRTYTNKTVIKEESREISREINRDLNINSTKDMWQAIQNTRKHEALSTENFHIFYVCFDCPEDLPLSVSTADIRGIFQTINVSSLKTLWHSPVFWCSSFGGSYVLELLLN